MEKINGSVYHKFINNYQKPIVITKRDSKNSCIDSTNKKNDTDLFQSKLIYVNKKTANVLNLNQNEIHSEMKTINNNSERTYTPLQNQGKGGKNGVKPVNSYCNGLPGNPKAKRKSHQNVNNEINKLNSKSIENDKNTILKRDKIKNKEEYLHNTMQKLKKLQNNINNINMNGVLENNNSAESEFDYLYNSNKINERKKNFIRGNLNLNNRELSRLIQENYNFNYHRKFNNYTDYNKSYSMLATVNNYNISSNNRTNNSIDCNCIENTKKENQNIANEEFYKTTKTCDEDDKEDIHSKASSNKSAKNKNMVLNSNIQKKKLKELQQKLDKCQKDLINTQKINIELEKKNEDLQKNLGIVKKKNEIYMSQIEELQNINIDNSKKIQNLESKMKRNSLDISPEGPKNDKYKNLEEQYKLILEKNSKMSNDFCSMNKEIKELKEIKNKYNILIKEHESLLKIENSYNELKMKYNFSQNNVKSLTKELNNIEKKYKIQKEKLELLNNEKKELKCDLDNIKLIKEINELKKMNEFLNTKNKELINSKKELTDSSTKENEIQEVNKNSHYEYIIQSNTNNIAFINDKNNCYDLNDNVIEENANCLRSNYFKEKNEIGNIKITKKSKKRKKISSEEPNVHDRKKSKLKKLRLEYKELNEKYNEINNENIKLNNTVNELNNICNMNNNELAQEILSVKELNKDLLKCKEENENKVALYEQKIEELNNQLLYYKEQMAQLNPDNNNDNNDDNEENNINNKNDDNDGNNTSIVINTVVKEIDKNEEDNNDENKQINNKEENNEKEEDNKEIKNENNEEKKDTKEENKENNDSINWEDYNFDDEDVESSDNNDNNSNDKEKEKEKEIEKTIKEEQEINQNKNIENNKDIKISDNNNNDNKNIQNEDNNNINNKEKNKENNNSNKNIKEENDNNTNDNLTNNDLTEDEADNNNKIENSNEKKTKKKKKKGGKRKRKLLELEEEINEKDSLIDEIHQEYKKIQNELTSYKTEINSLQNYITKLEAGLDINTQINNLKNIIYEKEQLLLTLSDQIAEYQSQCDDIIAGKSLKEKEEQIKLLISEVKAIRGKILNIITFNKRISNFDEFINCVDLIQQIKNDNSSDNNNKIKIAFEKINYLIDIYKQNNEDYYNKLIREIFKIYEKDNNVNEDNNNKEENREEK